MNSHNIAGIIEAGAKRFGAQAVPGLAGSKNNEWPPGMPVIRGGCKLMRAARLLAPLLISAQLLVSGCAYESLTAPPAFSERALQSLCDCGRPLLLRNRGYYQSLNGAGELLLVGHVANQPAEAYLGFQSVRLDYQPDKGLAVTLTGNQGTAQAELIPAEWIHCADDAMELKLQANTFNVWASVGVKTRRLRLQVTDDGGLVMRHLWEEKGMAAVVMPVKFTGDSWASFTPDDPADRPAAVAAVTIASIGDCQDLSGTYALEGVSVRPDGSLDQRTATEQFFRAEIMGPPTAGENAPEPLSLQVLHTSDGGIVLRLLLPDGEHRERLLAADAVTCETGRWIAKGAKDRLPAFMLLTGSMGGSSEDLRLSRDRDGALMVHGMHRSGGLLFLIPTGTSTHELFMRFPLLAAE